MTRSYDSRHRFTVEVVSHLDMTDKLFHLKEALRETFEDARVVMAEEMAPLYFPLGEIAPSVPPRSVLDDFLTPENMERLLDFARRLKGATSSPGA